MRQKFEVGGPGLGSGGLGAVDGEEGHVRWIGHPERDRDGIASPRFGCGRGLVTTVDEVGPLLVEKNRDRPTGGGDGVAAVAVGIDEVDPGRHWGSDLVDLAAARRWD